MTITTRLQRPSAHSSYLLLGLFESIAMLSCLALTIDMESSAPLSFFNLLICAECITFVAIVSLSMASLGLYHTRQRDQSREQLARLLISFALASVALAATFYFIPFLSIQPQDILASLVLSFLLVCLIRYGFFKLSRTELAKRRVLVLGIGEKAKIIDQRMRRSNDRRGFKVIGYAPVGDCTAQVPESKQLSLDMDQLESYIEQQHVDEVVVAADQRRGALPMQVLYNCRVAGVHITDITSFIEQECGKIPLNLLNPSWVIYSRGYRANDIVVRALKRLFDILISTVFLILTTPLMLITILLILLESGPRAPVFYSQIRVGLQGKHFKIFKFRSMQVDAECNGAVWAAQCDTRVTVVGAFIRKYRIDELPQLLNILKGDMSFIGPRPERPEFVEQLTEHIPYYGDRHLVKPGLTGWAQVCYNYGGSEQDAMEKLQYDLYYIKNFSFLLDTRILIETIEVVLFGKGAR